MFNKTRCIQLIEEKYPHLSEELHDECWEGLLHPQMGVFAGFAQTIIDSGEREQWAQLTSIFLELWDNCSSEVANALNVSFLEILIFHDGKHARSWAHKTMPSRMRDAWDKMNEYNRKLHGD